MVLSAGRPPVVEGLQLVRLVGRGGEGEVWEARDRDGQRRALKLVTPESLSAPEEAAIRGAWLVRIDHPALVRVHRSGVLGWVAERGGPRTLRAHPTATRDEELEGWGFVEMDFLDGDSLAAAPADPQVLHRLFPLAEALDMLHAGYWSDGVPLVHRDVKPANLMADADGRLVLVDFGTLRGVDAEDYTRVGTPLYSSPESFAGGGIGPAADVYSFAATIVALITGYRGRALAAALEDPQAAGFPPCIARALARSPSDRPMSCRALLSELLRFRSPPPLERVSGPPVAIRRPAVLPWIVWATLVLGAPWVVVVTRLGRGPFTDVLPARPLDLAVVGALALFAHLLTHIAAGTSIALTLFVPPLAWAALLAERAGGGTRRRAWARAALAPGCLAIFLSVPLVQTDGLRFGVVTAVAGVLVALLAVGAVRAGMDGQLLRVFALPLWVVGAVVFFVLGLLALPFALLVARGGHLLRYSAAPLAAIAETARPLETT